MSVCVCVSDTHRKVDLNKKRLSGTFSSAGAWLHDRQAEISESSLRGGCINCLSRRYINSAGPCRVSLSRLSSRSFCAHNRLMSEKTGQKNTNTVENIWPPFLTHTLDDASGAPQRPGALKAKKFKDIVEDLWQRCTVAINLAVQTRNGIGSFKKNANTLLAALCCVNETEQRGRFIDGKGYFGWSSPILRLG